MAERETNGVHAFIRILVVYFVEVSRASSLSEIIDATTPEGYQIART